MKKIVEILLIVTLILTVSSIAVIGYANVNSSRPYSEYPYSEEGTHPTDYGVWEHYFAEELETEPEPGAGLYTTEELGIKLVEVPDHEGIFDVVIVDAEKALRWMKYKEFHPYAVKYNNKFYQIGSLYVAPGLPENIKRNQILIAGVAAGSWVFTGVAGGVLFFKERKER